MKAYRVNSLVIVVAILALVFAAVSKRFTEQAQEHRLVCRTSNSVGGRLTFVFRCERGDWEKTISDDLQWEWEVTANDGGLVRSGLDLFTTEVDQIQWLLSHPKTRLSIEHGKCVARCSGKGWFGHTALSKSHNGSPMRIVVARSYDGEAMIFESMDDGLEFIKPVQQVLQLLADGFDTLRSLTTR